MFQVMLALDRADDDDDRDEDDDRDDDDDNKDDRDEDDGRDDDDDDRDEDDDEDDDRDEDDEVADGKDEQAGDDGHGGEEEGPAGDIDAGDEADDVDEDEEGEDGGEVEEGASEDGEADDDDEAEVEDEDADDDDEGADDDDEEEEDDDEEEEDEEEEGAGNLPPPPPLPQPLVLTPPAGVVAEATGSQTAVTIGAATASGGVGSLTLTSDAPATFPLGTTVVTWTATDAAGNVVTGTQEVIVQDTTAPMVTPPADVTAPATGNVTTVEIGAATATDAVGVVSLSNDAPAGFSMGTTTVTWTAVDEAGNTGTAAQQVTVFDADTLVVTPPGDLVVEASSSEMSLDIGVAVALGGMGEVSITNDAPATFPVGTTTVTWTATDAAGNVVTVTQQVTVQDTTAPVVTPPADVTVPAAGETTPVDIGMATATDVVGVVSISSDAPAEFLAGTTTVTWTAIDAAGNVGTAVQQVTVQIIEPLVITPPADVVIEATGDSTPVPDLGTATATGGIGAVSITRNAPSAFPVGITWVTWTATDEAGNTVNATQKVTVQDTTAPVVTPPADVTVPASGALTLVVIGMATATDAVGVVSISNNAPAGFPVGTTTVTWMAVDAAGNTGMATQQVTVQNQINAAGLYATYCAVCHGATRQGGFYGGLRPQDIAGMSDSELTRVIANGKSGMPGYAGVMTPEEISALVQWLRTP
ncbi:MAG: HYR domain-containing protein [Chloroflexi bacterium]|nr:HYR domain-containing protein [Chloroflexota bacterium]